jgi:hypothetical protein
VAALAFLIIGLVCAIVSRVLLFMAALRISAGWAFGLVIPFGPTLFRINYPDEAHRSRLFRLATLPCFFLYFVLGSGPGSFRHSRVELKHGLDQPVHYSMEKKVAGAKKTSSAPGPQVELSPGPSLDERRIANTHQFERLRAWNDALRLRKRDLLHSDAAGNLAYNNELEQYKSALEKANAERSGLWPSTK